MTPRCLGAHARALLPMLYLAAACDSEQAPRVTLPVVVDGSGIVEFDTNTGYRVRITQLRVAFDNVEFTSGGEMHASLLRRFGRGLGELLVPTAYAHPGHYAGGEVAGEMTGRFVVDWLDDGAPLGDADLLAATYSGANFVFTRATANDGLETDDPLVGHTMEIAGEATKGGETWTFHGFIDEEEGKRVIGLPVNEDIADGIAEFEVDGSTDVTFGLQMLMVDPFEPDTAFDNIDFAAADADTDGDIEFAVGDEMYNLLLRQLQVHDQYRVSVR
jgi:hypothetical protein